jgi:single-stranded-DNA-specific exonuclease
LQPESFEAFQLAFDQAVKALPEDAEQKPLHLDGVLRWEDLDLKTFEELERLGPFGPGNPEPLFALEAEVSRKSILKGRHLKLQLSRSESMQPASGLVTNLAAPSSRAKAGSATDSIEAIWFHAAEHLPWVESFDALLWAGVPELNRFRGKITPTFRIRDVRRLTESPGSP